ncbi:hypothetical protein AMECASPLE_012134 [Ameca splendens]|uniref:Uncharacterized protein n=1 Tax=Ameca splendens TaxID=208324 RepID=A0ABV0ZBR7_9TELE
MCGLTGGSSDAGVSFRGRCGAAETEAAGDGNQTVASVDRCCERRNQPEVEEEDAMKQLASERTSPSDLRETRKQIRPKPQE